MKIRLFTTFILCTLSPCLLANDLSYFLNLGIENSPSLLIKKKELEQSENNLKGSYSELLPSLDVKLSESKTKVDSITSDQSDAKLNMNVNLYNGGADNGKISIAKIGIKKSKENLRREIADMAYSIKQEYFNTLYATELKSLLETIVVRRKQQLDFINMLFEGGREDKGNYLQAKVKLKQASLEVTQSERLIRTSMKKLASNIGLSTNEIKSPTGSLLQYSNLYKDYSIKSFESEIEKVPEILIANYDLEIAKNNTSIANAAFRPSLDLNSSVGRNGETFNQLDTNTASVDLTLTIPLFDGGRDTYNSKIAKLEKINKEYWLRKEKIDLVTEITETRNLFQDSFENVSLQQELLEASKIRAKVATGKYTSGLMDYTTWDLIQTELITNEKNMLDALKQALLKKTELDKTLGFGVIHE